MTLELDWEMFHDGSSTFCPTCITQLYIGIADTFSECVSSRVVSPDTRRSGKASTTFLAPDRPGTYVVTRATTLDFACRSVNHSANPALAIAEVVVR